VSAIRRRGHQAARQFTQITMHAALGNPNGGFFIAVKKEETMAQLENQTIARMPVRETSRIRLLLNGNWHTEIDRMWGRKRVKRHIFRIESTDGTHTWFECNEQLAANILANIELFIVKNRVDRKKLEKLTMVISRSDNGEGMATVCEDSNDRVPRVGKLARFVGWLKGLAKIRD